MQNQLTQRLEKVKENFSRANPTVVCFSHLRWDFVYQRPQHLISRMTYHAPVYFVEEPIYGNIEKPLLTSVKKHSNLWVIKPYLPNHTSEEDATNIQKQLFSKFFEENNLGNLIFWYYTPMSFSFTEHLKPKIVVYDCMDELSHFDFAPWQLIDWEQKLFTKADIVFTGGQSLYNYKKEQHKHIFPFPSSIDKAHFAQSKTIHQQPEDQRNIKGFKVGFYGVIDERFDLELIRNIAELKPEWNLILCGPVVKIDPARIPQLPNVFLLGSKSYNELPAYLSGWDVALIPFAINNATKFISPTKTLEYLAAGVPVVSTPITDVVEPYEKLNLVKVATNAEGFVQAINETIEEEKTIWSQNVAQFLEDKSWDNTFESMMNKIMVLYNKKFKERPAEIETNLYSKKAVNQY